MNGMDCVVENYDAASKCVHVVTKTSRHLAVYPITGYVEDCGYVTVCPLRPGTQEPSTNCRVPNPSISQPGWTSKMPRLRAMLR